MLLSFFYFLCSLSNSLKIKFPNENNFIRLNSNAALLRINKPVWAGRMPPQAEPCAYCYGTGYIPCRYCFSEGCENCKGTTLEECPRCGGTGVGDTVLKNYSVKNAI